MMRKKMQVFISSTYIDLINERQRAVETILEAGHIPAGMEHFHASNESQLNTIYRWIDDCDLLILILGGRYGSIEQISGKSYVQLEYEYAMSHGIPCCGIVLSEEYIQKKIKKSGDYKIILEQDNLEKYTNFKNLVMTNRIIKIINDLSDISTAVTSPLMDYQKDAKIAGWIKGDHFNDNLSFFSDEDIYEFSKNLMLEYARRKVNFNFIPEIITSEMDKVNVMLKHQTFCESHHKIIEIEILDKYFAKITTSICTNYVNADDDFSFYIYTNMNKYQSETFKVELLQIDGHDYTDEVEITKSIVKNTGYFDYRVTSNRIRPKNRSFEVNYDTSYVCFIEDFYQAHRLEYPCRDFTVSAYINNNTENHYKLIASKYSALYHSSIENERNMPKEKHINNMCNFYFPTWSMPGTGYALSIKRIDKSNA